MVKAITLQGAFNYMKSENKKYSIILQTRQFDDDVNHVILLTKNEKDELVSIDASKQYVYRATKKFFAKIVYNDIVYAMSIEWKLGGKHKLGGEHKKPAKDCPDSTVDEGSGDESKGSVSDEKESSAGPSKFSTYRLARKKGRKSEKAKNRKNPPITVTVKMSTNA